METIKVAEFFGGIGACTQAFKKARIDYQVVDYIEIDKDAVRSYNAINGTNFEPQHTPQEVLNMYNLIFGQQESITRNFNDYVKRINEAMKYRYNDLID